MQREIEKGQEEAKSAELENGKLQAIIRSLEKDIVGLKHEIMERDETIQEKEKRTYDLKKKNQGTVLFSLPACWANNLELEKFKFVLDYKIKELKKQIEPREREIRANQEQIHEMESELERFHKSNTQLELALTESRQKLRVSHIEFSKKMKFLETFWFFSVNFFFIFLGCWPWIGARAIASSRFKIAKYSNFGWASRRSWIHSRSS